MAEENYTQKYVLLYPVIKKNRIRHEFNRIRQFSRCNLLLALMPIMFSSFTSCIVIKPQALAKIFFSGTAVS
jgi:hypothetical protein